MTIRLWVFFLTIAVCLLGVIRMIAFEDYNGAAGLALGVAIFVMDRAYVWEKADEKADEEEADNG